MYVHLSDAAVVPGAPLAGRVRPGREHPRPGARRTDPAVVRQPRRPGHRQPRHRPQRAHRRRGLRDPRPAAGTDHPDPPDLRVPLVHQTRPRPRTGRARRRLRPPGPLHEGPAQLLLQRRPALPAASPGQDPRRLDLHRPRTRDYVWTSPHGYQYLRDHHGTLDVAATGTPTRRTPAPTRRTTDSTAPNPAGPPPAGHRHVRADRRCRRVNRHHGLHAPAYGHTSRLGREFDQLVP